MKRILQFCFLLMVFGISAKAQEKETCFYHVSFYKWEWNYCYGRDTFRIHDSGGNHVKDTVVIDTGNHPHYFVLERKDSASFNKAHFKVKSINHKITYEVVGFELNSTPDTTYAWTRWEEGAYLSTDALKWFYHSNSGTHFWFGRLRIFDHKLQKDIYIPGIEIEVR